MMNPAIAAYQDILCPQGAPGFLAPYLDAPEIRRLGGVGLFCGTDYTNLYRHDTFYSRLHHSVGVALIVWHFTRDRAQTLAGLLHDIATPVFSHSVDFMNGDAATQTSTEAATSQIIRSSPHIMAQLAADGIAVEAVEDYHMYPIADNDSPRLSADRLEYTLSTGLIWLKGWDRAEIGRMYADLRVLQNESGAPELGFQTVAQAEKFALGSAKVCKLYQMNENKLALSLLGDLLKMGIARGLFTPGQLYQMTEAQAIARMESAPYEGLRKGWAAFVGMDKVYRSPCKPEGCYSVNVNAKRRYINPLCQTQSGIRRAAQASPKVQAAIDALLSFEDAPYGYVDFRLDW